MEIKKATLKSFNSTGYTATICLSQGYKVYLEGVAVARNLPVSEMIAGRKLAVIFFEENNPGEAVIAAVYN